MSRKADAAKVAVALTHLRIALDFLEMANVRGKPLERLRKTLISLEGVKAGLPVVK